MDKNKWNTRFEANFPHDAEGLRQLYEERYTGTFRSNLWFLLKSCASTYLNAAQQLAGTIEARDRGLSKDVNRAEVLVMLELNYGRFASGPLLAATLMPSLALESYLWLCGTVALYREPSPGMFLALHGLDRIEFAERLSEVVRLCGAPKMPSQLDRALKALIAFRNGTVHDKPLLQMPNGQAIQARNSKTRAFDLDQAYKGVYPVIGNRVLSLSLKHAKKSIDAYDGFVAHIENKASDEFKDLMFRCRSPELKYSPKIQGQGYGGWDKAEEVHEYWEKVVLPWTREVPMAERNRFLESLARKQKVKLVVPDSTGSHPLSD